MTISQIAEAVRGEFAACADLEHNITSFYAGDFLSRVMGKAPSGCCWFTVMANVNVAGVAVLADVKAIVLCEGVVADEALKAKCAAEGIALLCSPLGMYECCRLAQ